MENKDQNQQLQIQLRPELADGKYTNLAMIGHNPSEFLIDFIFAAPGMPQAPVVSRVIMSPEIRSPVWRNPARSRQRTRRKQLILTPYGV